MSDYITITCPINSGDDKLFVGIVNQGIDSHLEGICHSKFSIDGRRRKFKFHKKDMGVLIRRLTELETDEATRWAEDLEGAMKCKTL